MSEWITDRRPTLNDTNDLGCVWVTSIENNTVYIEAYERVCDRPWKQISKCEPYVKPKKRFKVFASGKYYAVYNVVGSAYCIADEIHSEEAAQRIAAIYEEVMP